MTAKVAIAVLVATVLAALAPAADAQTLLSRDQLVELAIEANPQVRAARARWLSVQHSIKQAYAPNDPQFTFGNIDSPNNPFDSAALRSYQVTEAFQFPGKAMLQTEQARRNADIARLALAATVRDVRAAVETGYYQLVLDSSLAGVNQENLSSLESVLNVTKIAYQGNRVTQTDFISAEFDLASARQLQLQYQVNIANDVTGLNLLLGRQPDEPVSVDRTLALERLTLPVDMLVNKAELARQEILEAALMQRNSDTALSLAKMEYLPDFTAGYVFDNYLLTTAGPSPNSLQDHGFTIGMNVPIFFWLKQNEDVTRARYDLEAARNDLASVRNQTGAAVTSLYRSVQYAYETALLYRDSLTPLARQNFQVAVTAYQAGKIDFVTLSSALQREYSSRIAYLQAANQFLAGEVALEQAMGEPLPR